MERKLLEIKKKFLPLKETPLAQGNFGRNGPGVYVPCLHALPSLQTNVPFSEANWKPVDTGTHCWSSHRFNYHGRQQGEKGGERIWREKWKTLNIQSLGHGSIVHRKFSLLVKEISCNFFTCKRVSFDHLRS